MWERFEGFWTAFEKFALFFSFMGTLVTLTILALLYGAAAGLRDAVPPTMVPTPPVAPIVQTVQEGFERIQGAVSPVVIPISHTVPITLNIRINPEQLELRLADSGELKTGRVVINLDDAGKLVGKDATLQLPEGSTLKAKLDISKQVVFVVPIQIQVPIEVPSSVDLRREIEALKAISATVGTGAAPGPQPAQGGQ